MLRVGMDKPRETTWTPRAIIGLPFALPFIALHILTVLVLIVIQWVEHRFLPWLGRGIGNHFYWPFLIIQRTIQGKPTWWPQDLKLGRQPRTDEERARAEAHPNVVPAVCGCSNPDCENKTRPYFAWVAVPRSKSAQAGAELETIPEALKQMQQTLFDNAKKAAAYDVLAAEHEEIKRLYAKSVADLLALRQRVEEHAQTLQN